MIFLTADGACLPAAKMEMATPAGAREGRPENGGPVPTALKGGGGTIPLPHRRTQFPLIPDSCAGGLAVEAGAP